MTRAVTFRQADLDRALAVAEKRGLAVAGYEITREGTIRVLTGPASADLPSPDLTDSDWEARLRTWRRSA